MILILLMLLSPVLYSQQSAIITYNFYSNGSPAGTPPLVLEASSVISKYINASGGTFYIDHPSQKTYQTTLLK
ncbi:MAG TPA: hypothetical protein PKE39_08030, partial [Ignavibacteria bacterium]|nr:hypothetical protein [Ignavibacteria bacterium]